MNTKLNLGSGEFRKEGYINVDFSADADIKHDLNEHPWPFSDNSFCRIEADHLLEHLDSPFDAMREIHRVARHNAEVIIRVPHFSRGFTHPEHRSGFDVSFPLYFDPSFQGGYQGVEFRQRGLRLRWFSQPYLKQQVMGKWQLKIGNCVGKLIDFLANLSPWLCSRLWCNWVGGFEEMEFRLVAIKPRQMELFMGCNTIQRRFS